MKPNVKIPSRDGSTNTESIVPSETSNIVIIGANGSGKSRMGAKIEALDSTKVHRISAQRALNIPEAILLKGYDVAYKELLGGESGLNHYKTERWGWEYGYTTTLIDDFNKVLSTIFAKQSKSHKNYFEACKIAEINDTPKPITPITDIDIIHEIWKDIFPHRTILIDDAKVSVGFKASSYSGKELSDGEKVVIYMISQCLSIEDGMIIIIDEPELHLHKSLMYRVWNKIEEYCQNKLLIYITHDLDFAASRVGAKKLWIKEFNGVDSWLWEEIREIEDIPENLAIELLGNRKNVLFTEGEKGSFDTRLYQYFYDKFLIVPRGSCESVITSTKGMQRSLALNHLKCYGIIDRDFRLDTELNKLSLNSIAVIEVAEVENLFCIEGILYAVAEITHPEDIDGTVKRAKEYVFDQFKKNLADQVSKKTEIDIQYRLNSFSKINNTKEGLIQGYNDFITNLNVELIYDQNIELFNKILNEEDYKAVLRYFNYKPLSKTISTAFKIFNGEYVSKVFQILNSPDKFKIIDALKSYLPELT